MDITNAPLNDVFRAWEVWKQRSSHAVTTERMIRAELVRRLHPAPTEGSNHAYFDLDPPPEDGLFIERAAPGRYDFLLKHSIERKVDEGALEALKTAATRTTDHPLAAVNFDTLIRRKPELAVTPYKALTDLQRTWFDTCLFIKPGSPQVELKPYKGK